VLLDQPRQRVDRQAEFADRVQELGCDRIALDAAMAGAFQHVGPPLQPHFARQRLADLLAHARDLDVEGEHDSSARRRATGTNGVDA
jgi:hypothetical protein